MALGVQILSFLSWQKLCRPTFLLHCWQSNLPAELRSHYHYCWQSHLPADALYYHNLAQHGNVFRLLHALALATNTLWARPCLSVCLSRFLQQWDLGSQKCNNDQRAMLEDTVAQQWPRYTSVWEWSEIQQWPGITLVQERPQTQNVTYLISATTTFVMCIEEHIWNFGVLQRVSAPSESFFMCTYTVYYIKTKVTCFNKIRISCHCASF
jgi:hypothetical protein